MRGVARVCREALSGKGARAAGAVRLVVRLGTATALLVEAALFASLALDQLRVAQGAVAHGAAGAAAAFVLGPAAAVMALALAAGSVSLAVGDAGPGQWSRTALFALAGLPVASVAAAGGVWSWWAAAALVWPATLGVVFGLRRWDLGAPLDEPAEPLLLVFEPPSRPSHRAARVPITEEEGRDVA